MPGYALPLRSSPGILPRVTGTMSASRCLVPSLASHSPSLARPAIGAVGQSIDCSCQAGL
jgi:hypothetical protein